MSIRDWFITKKNPVQSDIKDKEPTGETSTPNKRTAQDSYKLDPVFNRCINILVDSQAEVKITVGKKLQVTPLAKGLAQINQRKDGPTASKALLARLLEIKPNLYQDANSFWRLLLTDYWMSGRAFAVWDGAAIYHIPENEVTVYAGANNIVEYYEFGDRRLSTDEVIFIKDNSYLQGVGASAISANSRYKAAENDIVRKDKLSSFKERYLDNGTMLGLILESESVLSKTFKDKLLDTINVNFNTKNGKFMNSAIILDAGLKAKNTAQIDMGQLGINEDKKAHNDAICTQMGVPPILLEGGNNANIRPNIDLMFSLTILPNLKKVTGQLSAFFGYSFELDTSDVFALSPDTQKEATRITQLVNNGLITADEGRVMLGLSPLKLPETTEIRVPQNIQGSSTGVSGQEGGRPDNEDDK